MQCLWFMSNARSGNKAWPWEEKKKIRNELIDLCNDQGDLVWSDLGCVTSRGTKLEEDVGAGLLIIGPWLEISKKLDEVKDSGKGRLQSILPIKGRDNYKSLWNFWLSISQFFKFQFNL